MTAHFELLFEGPADDSPPTLRRIKGVFIADLEFPTSDVQRFLENAPITIKSANSESELAETYSLLTKAGARVLIVKKEDGASSKINSDNNLELLPPLTFKHEDSISISNHDRPVEKGDSESALELSFDFGIDPTIETQDKTEPKTPEIISKEEFTNNFTLDLSFDQIEDSKSDILAEKKSESFDSTRTEEFANHAAKGVTSDHLSLELEVITPASSTLFAQHQSPNKAEAQHNTDVVLENKGQEQESTSNNEIVHAHIEEANLKINSNNQSYTDSEESPIELTLEELKALQKPPPKNIKLPLATIILSILCLLGLFYINQLFFSESPKENPFIALVESLPKITGEPDKLEQEKLLAEKAAELAKTTWYISDQNFSNRSVKATIWVEKSAPIHGSIEISTQKPAELSKEEIVNGVSPRPWLRRMEAKDLVFKLENSIFIASGPALAYISIGDKNIRLSGSAKLQAKLSEDEKTLELKALAYSQQPPGNDNIFNFSVAEAGQQTTNQFEYAEEIKLVRQ